SLILNDTLPPAFLNAVFTPSTGSYSSATHSWTGLNLASGQLITMTVAGKIDPSATGSIVNSVHVDPPVGTTDTNPGNNTATDTDTLTKQCDLSIVKSFSDEGDAQPDLGEVFKF